MTGDKGARDLWIRCHDRARHGETQIAQLLKLARLGVVGRRRGGAIDHPDRHDLHPGDEGFLEGHGVPPQRVAGAFGRQLLQHAQVARSDVDARDIGETDFLRSDTQRPGDIRPASQFDRGVRERPLVEERDRNTQSPQLGFHARVRAIGCDAPEENHRSPLPKYR
jgi:hypothetical protein